MSTDNNNICFGIKISVMLKSSIEEIDFIDDFLDLAIEKNNCFFGGAICGGIIELGDHITIAKQRFKNIRQWLEFNPNVDNFSFGEIIDISD